MNQQFNDDHPWTLAKEIRTKISTNYSELATKLYNSEKQNKIHEDDIKYYVGLTRRLKKLLNENNIEYEEMVKDYDALTFHKDNEE